MAALMLCYRSIAPCTCKDDIGASAICHLKGFAFRFNVQVGLNRLSLAALVAYPMALHSALLHRGYSQRMEVADCTLELTLYISSNFSVTELPFLNS